MRHFVGMISGFLGGFFGGLLGVGGGVIMIPLMTWLSKLTQHQAHGTSLVAIAFSASVGSATYFAKGSVDWKVSLLLAASAIITARIGARLAHSLPERTLKKAFGFFLVFASLSLLMKGYLPAPGGGLSFWTQVPLFLLIGAATGFLSGMMGVGGGGVMVPPMVMIAGMGQHLAQGTSLLAMVPASISGAITHYKLGNVRTDIAWGLAIGSLAGGYAGATAAAALPEPALRVFFAGMGLWMGVRYIRT
jgi:uncharacterized protein